MNTEHVNLFKAYILFIKNYFNFKGNSTRSEYWWAFFWNWLIRIVLLLWILVGQLKGNAGTASSGKIILIIFCLAVIVPCISLTVRRYRNAGVSPYWILLTYVMPYVLGFAVYEAMQGNTMFQYFIWNACALLEFICLVCAVIIPMLPTATATKELI